MSEKRKRAEQKLQELAEKVGPLPCSVLAAGAYVTTVEEFLGLSENESGVVERRLTYETWIDAYKVRNPLVRGMCSSATLEMATAFPELTRVAGFVTTMLGETLEHFWLEAEDGYVVDPTVSQFPGGVLEYRLFQPHDEIRVGRCMECGADIYACPASLDEEISGKSLCGDECEQAFIEFQDGKRK